MASGDSVNLAASGAMILFFVAAIGTYAYHGWRRDTDNQFRDRHPATGTFMILLIIAEVGGFAVSWRGSSAPSSGELLSGRRPVSVRYAG